MVAWVRPWRRRATRRRSAASMRTSLPGHIALSMVETPVARPGPAAGSGPLCQAATWPSSRGPVPVGPDGPGKGSIVLGPPGFDLAMVGYAEVEHFVSGDAQSFTSDEPLTVDGQWDVRVAEAAPFTTRIVVRRPVDPGRFDGTVVVEWLNVTRRPRRRARLHLHRTSSIMRSAATAWVGVSAQRRRHRRPARPRRPRLVHGAQGGRPRALRLAVASRRRLLVRHLPPGRRARRATGPTPAARRPGARAGAGRRASRSRPSGSAPT